MHRRGRHPLNGEASDMNEQCEIIVFKVRRESDGLFTATSPQLSGVFVAHRDLDRIIEDMPNIVRLWFKRHKNAIVEVFQGPSQHYDDSSSYSSMTVPAEIAAQALAQ
jgi:hypothetical protein